MVRTEKFRSLTNRNPVARPRSHPTNPWPRQSPTLAREGGKQSVQPSKKRMQVVDSQKLAGTHEIATNGEAVESGLPHLAIRPADGGLSFGARKCRCRHRRYLR